MSINAETTSNTTITVNTEAHPLPEQESKPDSGSSGTLFLVLSFALFALVLYGSTLNAFFLADDFCFLKYVQSNPLGTMFHNLLPGTHEYRPLSFVSIGLEYLFFGLDPRGYHCISLLLHLANCLLLVCIIRLIMHTHSSASSTAWIAGAIFLVLPVNSEAVAWICSGRQVLLASLLSLLSINSYLWHVRTNKSIYLLFSIGAYGMSLLSKESGLLLFALILLYELFLRDIQRPIKVRFKQAIYISLLYLLMFFLYYAARAFITKKCFGNYADSYQLAFEYQHLARALVRFNLRMLLPCMGDVTLVSPQLASYYLWFHAVLWNHASYVIAGILAVVFITFCLRRLLRLPLVLFYLCISCWILMYPGIIISCLMFDTQGERNIYLAASLGAAFIAALLTHFLRSRWLLFLGGGVLVLFWAYFLLIANTKWHEAGLITQALLEDFNQLAPGERHYLLNLPDNYQGAYIFRNGLHEAIALFTENSPEVKIINTMWLRNKHTATTVSLDNGNYLVTTDCPSPYFHFRDPGPFIIKAAGQNSYTIKIKPLPAATRLYYYSQKRLLEFPAM